MGCVDGCLDGCDEGDEVGWQDGYAELYSEGELLGWTVDAWTHKVVKIGKEGEVRWVDASTRKEADGAAGQNLKSKKKTNRLVRSSAALMVGLRKKR